MRIQSVLYPILSTIALASCGGSAYKKRQTALTHYKQASLEVKDFTDKRDLGALHKALNNVDKSLAVYETPNARALKGTILLQLGALSESITIFEHIVADKRTSKAKRADAQNNLATALYQQGNYTRAKQLWQELAANTHYISPEVAHYNLGYAALNEACKAAYNNNQQARAIHLQEAVQHLQNAIAISHEFIDAHFYVANALAALNQPVSAREHLIAILAINPDHAPAQKMLNYIESISTQPNIVREQNESTASHKL